MKTDNRIEDFKLNDEELEVVSGGSDVQYMQIACPHCGKVNNVNIMSDKYKCSHCKATNTISG